MKIGLFFNPQQLTITLPGSEGGNGIYDVLFGAVSPTAKLSVAWPVSVDQLPADNFISGTQTPLYPVGYGLTW